MFDKIICAFKINEMRVELSRRTHEKNHDDFIRCTLLPKKTEICFLDNSIFDGMKHNHIYYIQPPSYYHRLSHKTIIDRFVSSKIADTISDNHKLLLYKTGWGIFTHAEFDSLNEKDIIISQKIMYHIKEFFFLGKKKRLTRKYKNYPFRKTRKKLFGQ